MPLIWLQIVRTFTGAWIETWLTDKSVIELSVRTFTGAWIETTMMGAKLSLVQVRTFTGAWIETPDCNVCQSLYEFAPSRVRGLKLYLA